MPRLAIADFMHEGNAFSPVKATEELFRSQTWLSGPAVAERFRGTRTEMGAAVDFLATHPDWQGTFLTCAEAGPCGPLTDACFQAIKAEIVAGLVSGRWDAVYLALHGAMMADSTPAADLDLLRSVRAAIGDTPLAVSFDLHANLGQPQVGLFDVACVYKTHPHVDQHETATKALGLLARRDAGTIRPVGTLVKVPAILPSANMRTTDGPMAEMMRIAGEVERRDGLLDVSVIGGFAYGDSPYAGASVMVHVDGDRALAKRAAAEVAREYEARVPRFYVTLPGPEEGIARALQAPPGAVAVIENADNPGSGGIGDTTGLFRALMAAKPEGPTVFCFFFDPAVVARAQAAGVGGRIEAKLGGRIVPGFGAPVPFAGTVERLTDGRFRNIGPMENGAVTELGPSCVLADGNLRVIVTSTCQSPNDPGLFVLHGIDVTKQRLVCVKAKNHFRAGFRPLIATMIDVDTPGPASLDQRSLPFRHAPTSLRRA